MGRVAAQGDLRPMAANKEAMDDLKGILADRTPFYAKAGSHPRHQRQAAGMNLSDLLRSRCVEALARSDPSWLNP